MSFDCFAEDVDADVAAMEAAHLAAQADVEDEGDDDGEWEDLAWPEEMGDVWDD